MFFKTKNIFVDNKHVAKVFRFQRKKFNGINTINNDRDFCQLLLEKYGVAVVPGSEFGTPGYFRLCFAKSEDDLKNACQRINDFLKLLN